QGFHKTYPKTLDRLNSIEGIEVRLLDLKKRTGGVQHAKFALIDGRQTFLGSPNFDWRSLEHIQELSALIDSAEVTAFYRSVFELDWRLAGGEEVPENDAALRTGAPAPKVKLKYRDQTVQVTPVASPKGLIPCAHDACWDLPRLLELIDGAKSTVRLQLLSYKPAYRNRTYFAELDNALRRAAARRVRVEMMVANWSQTRGRIEALKSLQVLPNVEVKIVTMPEWSGGFINFARVVHSKYLVADGARSWIGTSNGSGDYFTASRNVGLIVEGGAFGADLDRYFERLWKSGDYAKTVDPCAEYAAPERSR
ncbi:MAG: phospholipase D-like domain-containing protein, partial [Planctomycetota bacterium]